MKTSYTKWIVLSLAIMLVVLGTMTKFSNPKEVGKVLSTLGVKNTLVILAFGTSSLLIRNYRWKTLLRGAGFDVGYCELFPIFASGQAASLITPGKSGDLLRTYGLKTARGFEIKKTIATIFVERFTDFALILVFTIYGFSAFGAQSLIPVAVIAAVMVLGAGTIVSRRVARKVKLPFMPLVNRVLKLKKLKGSVREAYYAIRALGKTSQFYYSTILGIVVWTIEFSRMHFTILALGGLASPAEVAFAACLSILVGMATMLPGGAGGYEASYMTILTMFGVSVPVVAGALIVERVIGYGFTLLVGLISMKWVKT